MAFRLRLEVPSLLPHLSAISLTSLWDSARPSTLSLMAQSLSSSLLFALFLFVCVLPDPIAKLMGNWPIMFVLAMQWRLSWRVSKEEHFCQRKELHCSHHVQKFMSFLSLTSQTTLARAGLGRGCQLINLDWLYAHASSMSATNCSIARICQQEWNAVHLFHEGEK